MPISLKVHITKPWKESDEKVEPSERLPIVVVQFNDAETGKQMFQYAPRRSDEEFWKNLFKHVEEYYTTMDHLMQLNEWKKKEGCDAACRA